MGSRRVRTLAVVATATCGLLLLGCSDADDISTSESDAVDGTATEADPACDQLIGVWRADELAGSEDEIGGVYRATLELRQRGEVSWSESDFIEVWDSWGCVGTDIIGFFDSSARWIDGERVPRDPNPCPDLTTSEIREAAPDETIESASRWVRCRGGRFEEGAAIARITDEDTLTRRSFTLTR